MTPDELRTEIARIGREQSYLIQQAVEMDLADEIPDGWTIEFAPEETPTPPSETAPVADQYEPVGGIVTRVHSDGTITLVKPDMTEGEHVWAEMDWQTADNLNDSIDTMLDSYANEAADEGFDTAWDGVDPHSLHDYVPANTAGEVEFAIVGFDANEFIIAIRTPEGYDPQSFNIDDAEMLSGDLTQAISEAYSIQIGSAPQ